MKIQILGTGCPKCKKTYENAEQAIKDLDICADLEKVEDLKAIMGFGIMVTPALAIDGEVKAAGKIPSVEEVKRFITEKGQD
ncbi:thioredoxin family protein [Candidatus Eisenbacteria bacterium]|uniref:Thioredoxin family protein n=1 Tax=Eiseniibacteriota bacterium TaxID=2212470 RepID=A0ABV6YQ75_UNCEI